MKRLPTVAVIVSLLVVSPALHAGSNEPQEPTRFEMSVSWAQTLFGQIIALLEAEAGADDPPPSPSNDAEQASASEPDVDPGAGETHPIVEPAG